jgi:hypothetical protein
MNGQKPAISGQEPAISGQKPAISGQKSAGSNQQAAISDQLTEVISLKREAGGFGVRVTCHRFWEKATRRRRVIRQSIIEITHSLPRSGTITCRNSKSMPLPSEAGGFTARSRWLSEATPPVKNPKNNSILKIVRFCRAKF